MSQYGTRVTGLRETLSTLRDTDRKLYFATIARMKKAVKPIATDIDRAIPAQSPFAGRSKDGWTHDGRTSWTNRKKAQVKYGGRRYRSGSRDWPLLRVIVADAPGVMYDMAGKGRLAEELGGSPSRAVWPVAHRHKDTVEAAVKKAVDDVERDMNPRLRTGWGV